MHDLARSRSSTRSKKVADVPVAGLPRGSRLSLSRRPPARAPLLVGGLLGGSRPHRKVLRRWHLQADEPSKPVERGLRLSTTFYRWAEPSLSVQPLWNRQARRDSAVYCGQIFREPATPLQIQMVLSSHVSH